MERLKIEKFSSIQFNSQQMNDVDPSNKFTQVLNEVNGDDIAEVEHLFNRSAS